MTPAQPLPTDPRFEKLRNGEPLEFPAPPKDREETLEEKAARTIPAHWLELLAEGHKRVVSVPVRISNAIIDGPLNLRSAVFECGFSVTDSKFSDAANFSFATFQHAAQFDGSHFLKPAYFRATRAQADFEIRRASFADKAIFQDLHVDEVLLAQGAEFGAVNFDRVEVCKSAFFRTDGQGHRVTFGGEARFHGAHIGGNASFIGAEFKAQASFENIQVGGNAFFRTDKQGHRTTFEGKVRFSGAPSLATRNFSAQTSKKMLTSRTSRLVGMPTFVPMTFKIVSPLADL